MLSRRVASLFVCLWVVAAAKKKQPTDADVAKLDPEDQPESWGFVKMAGGHSGFEFFKADFGGDLVCGELPVVIADPPHGCGKLKNAADVEGKILVSDRGECSFQSKQAWAAAAGAKTLLVANTVPGLFSMPPGIPKVC